MIKKKKGGPKKKKKKKTETICFCLRFFMTETFDFRAKHLKTTKSFEYNHTQTNRNLSA